MTHLKAALEAGKAKSAELAQQSAEAKATKLELSTSLDAAKRSAAELDQALAIGAGTRTCIGWTFAVVAPDDTVSLHVGAVSASASHAEPLTHHYIIWIDRLEVKSRLLQC